MLTLPNNFCIKKVLIFMTILYLDEKLIPGFPLLPLSKGFCLSVKKALNDYKEILVSMNIMFK